MSNVWSTTENGGTIFTKIYILNTYFSQSTTNRFVEFVAWRRKLTFGIIPFKTIQIVSFILYIARGELVSFCNLVSSMFFLFSIIQHQLDFFFFSCHSCLWLAHYRTLDMFHYVQVLWDWFQLT